MDDAGEEESHGEGGEWKRNYEREKEAREREQVKKEWRERIDERWKIRPFNVFS